VSANNGWPRLPLEAMSDIELLTVFEDSVDGDGGATAVAVAEHTDEGVQAAKSIGQRFSWLARWGYMDQDKRTKKWYLTQEGERLRSGVRLNDRQRDQVRRFAQQALGLGDVLGTALDREDRRMVRRQIRYREVNG
jgi:hypothetical protein